MLYSPALLLSQKTINLLTEFPTFDALPLSGEVRAALRPVAEGKLADNILLYGANGVGKSALAQLLPCWYHMSNGDDPYLHFINSASEFDFPRLEAMASVAPLSGLVGWTVFDELDKVPAQSKQTKILALVEKYVERSYIATANNVADLDSGIISRFECIEVTPPKIEDLIRYAQGKLRNKNYTDDELHKQLSPVASDLRVVGRRIRRLAL